MTVLLLGSATWLWAQTQLSGHRALPQKFKRWSQMGTERKHISFGYRHNWNDYWCLTYIPFYIAFFSLPPSCWATPLPCPSPFFPPSFTPPPPHPASLHTPSVFVSLRRSFSQHAPHFCDSLVSLRWINPKIYNQAGAVYKITASLQKKKINSANSFKTFCQSFSDMRAIKVLHGAGKPKVSHSV